MVLFADRYLHVSPKVWLDGKQSLLWPVFAWKVLFPADDQRLGANLFQEAILGLIRAGQREVSEIGGMLALDPELVRYIIHTQLQPNAWLTNGMKITPAGEALLDDAEDSRLRLKIGYAFQDAIAGAWLPRFVTELPEIRPQSLGDKGRPEFLVNRERGWTERPFVLPSVIRTPSSDIGAITVAYRAYRKDLAAARRLDSSLDFGLDFQSIETISTEPTPMYLLCELYRDEGEPQPWLVSDPFRLRRAASWLREPLLNIAPRNPGLIQRMQKLVGAPDEGCSAEEWLRQVDENAELALWRDYPFVMKHSLIREHLARLLRQTLKVEGQSRVNGEDMATLVGEAHNLLEAVLKWMLQRWPIDTRSWPRKNWTPSEAKDIFQNLKLSAVSPRLIDQLAGQPLKAISDAIRTQDRPLKALLAGAVFCAAEHRDHPFRTLDCLALSLEDLPSLADFRNKASGHASGSKYSSEEVVRQSRFAIQWMALFQPWY